MRIWAPANFNFSGSDRPGNTDGGTNHENSCRQRMIHGRDRLENTPFCSRIFTAPTNRSNPYALTALEQDHGRTNRSHDKLTQIFKTTIEIQYSALHTSPLVSFNLLDQRTQNSVHARTICGMISNGPFNGRDLISMPSTGTWRVNI